VLPSTLIGTGHETPFGPCLQAQDFDRQAEVAGTAQRSIVEFPVPRSVPMDRCVEKRNVRHLRGRLFSELEPHTRSCVERLLVEEENKLGADLELIAEVERAIANFDALIVTQQALVAALERPGHECDARDRGLLDGMRQSQRLHKEYHQSLLVTFMRWVARGQGPIPGPVLPCRTPKRCKGP
jgi:hypothetical protein